MTLLDRIVTVTVDVHPGALGKVTVAGPDGFREHYAKAADGGAIPAGTPVRITAEEHTIVTVETLH